jgi:hypothetical protein
MHKILVRAVLMFIFRIQTFCKILNKCTKFHKKNELDESFVYLEYSGSTLREI